MNRRILGLAALLLGVTGSSAYATPKLSGIYMMSGTFLCQVVTGGNAVGPGGYFEQNIGLAKFSPTTTGATGGFDAAWLGGQLIATDGSVNSGKATVSFVMTISGARNPYSLTVKATGNSKTMTMTGKVQLSKVVNAVAEQAAITVETDDRCTVAIDLYRK